MLVCNCLQCVEFGTDNSHLKVSVWGLENLNEDQIKLLKQYIKADSSNDKAAREAAGNALEAQGVYVGYDPEDGSWAVILG